MTDIKFCVMCHAASGFFRSSSRGLNSAIRFGTLVYASVCFAAAGCHRESEITAPGNVVAPSSDVAPNIKAAEQTGPPTGRDSLSQESMPPLPQMILVKAGTFQMGSPESEADRDQDETLKTVTLESDFWLGKYEITVRQFRHFVDSTGFRTTHEVDGDDYHWRKVAQGDEAPVVAVSWHDANAYCDWLSKETNETYRLPTEAEWEYACRAGTQTAFHVGDVLSKDDANFGSSYVVAVGSYAPNDFGLYDMHGNVFEWCQDEFVDEFTSEEEINHYHTVKGGSWSMRKSKYCRAAHREGMRGGNLMMGFRVAKDVK